MDLEATLARVSRNCLRGQPVPADLAALWKAKLEGHADLLDGLELTLVDDLSGDFLAGYGDATGAPAPAARAHRRMSEHIAYCALTMDDGLLGYWLGEGNRPVGDAPVVEVDGEGQYQLRGSSVTEYLLRFAGSPAEFEEFRAWLANHGIAVTTGSRADVDARLKRFEEPDAQYRRYEEEERAKGG
jgi:hypothetical protein